MAFKLPEGRTLRVLFHACEVLKTTLSLGCLAQQGYWSDLRADTGTLFFLDKTQTKHSQTQLYKEESLFFVEGMLVVPLLTAGVSDEVALELQKPIGPQMLEDVEERSATLKDPGTPDRIVMEQHSLTHFPSQPWCKMCVESRGRDSPHREQSKIDAVVPQLQFDYGYMGDGGLLQIACFLVGADTSSGAIHAPRRWTCPMLLRQQPNVCATLGMNAFVYTETIEGVLQLLLLDNVARECRPEGQDWQIPRQVSPTQSHQSNGAAEKAVSTGRGLAITYLAVLKIKIRLFEVTTHSPMLPWTIRHAAWVLTRYNVRRDTRMTPYEKIRGQKYRKGNPATG